MLDREVLVTLLPHVCVLLANLICALTTTLEGWGVAWAMAHTGAAVAALSCTAMEDLVELAHRRHRFPAWPEQPREEPPC